MTPEDMETEMALEELERDLNGGYTGRFADSGPIESHPLTTNDSNRQMMLRPPRYKHLPKLPAIKFGKR